MKKKILISLIILITLGLLLNVGGNARALEQSTIYLPITLRNYCHDFFDDFSNPESGWPIFEDEDVLYEYLNGEYRILVKNAEWWAAASPDYQAADYIVTVDVRRAGDVWGKYGIIFGLAENWSHFYIFEIDPDGNYNIWRYSSSSERTLLKWGNSPYINQSSASNAIKVKRSGSQIEVYANDHSLASLTDDTYTGLGYLGLIVDTWNFGNVDARFDNFMVETLSCGAGTLKSDEKLSLMRNWERGEQFIRSPNSWLAE